jgi:hypothetical protein
MVVAPGEDQRGTTGRGDGLIQPKQELPINRRIQVLNQRTGLLEEVEDPECPGRGYECAVGTRRPVRMVCHEDHLPIPGLDQGFGNPLKEGVLGLWRAFLKEPVGV